MKKIYIYYSLLMFCGLGLAGCTGNANSSNSKYTSQNSVDQVLESQIEAQETSDEQETAGTEAASADVEATKEEAADVDTEEVTAAAEEGNAEDVSGQDTDVDIDLTSMSSDMVYATVYQLMIEPERYVGKTIKMDGLYYASWYEATQQYYHYVIIQDAAACCSSGMEFVWEDGSHVYPDEYPEDETEIEVVGVFETYTEEGDENLYCRLRDASIVTSNK